MNRMRQARRLRRGDKPGRSGSIVILVVVMLPVFLIMAAFALNMAYMELTRAELRIATDAAARAGAHAYSQTGDAAKAMAAARLVAGRHRVANSPLQLADSDFTFGRATRPHIWSRYQFSTSGAPFNALRVTGQRTRSSPNGVVRLLMPNLIGGGSFQPAQVATAAQTELDIAVVLDRSGSMAYADDELSDSGVKPRYAPPGWAPGWPAPSPSRWRDAVAGMNAFLGVLSQSPTQERVALTTYSSDVRQEMELTTNYSLIVQALDVHTQSYLGAMTNIGGGIDGGRVAVQTGAMARPWATKILVVMTDGRHNIGQDPEPAARQAAQEGCTIYTITFSQEANRSRMQSVARMGSGRHYHAANGQELIAAFESIARSFPTLLVQ